MKTLYKAALLFAGALSLSSCSKYFDREPEDKFAADLFFRTQADLEYYTNGLIDTALPSIESITIGDDQYSDFCATKNSKSFFVADQYSAATASGWSASNWSFLRQVAYMLDNMHNAKNAVSPEIYDHYEGVARFFRALSTFNKVRTFGDCYWIDHVVGTNDTTILYGPRQDREYIMHKIVEDLSFCVDHCLATGEKINTAGCIYINKYTALALASRICLFEGTYRKYHKENPSTGKAWTGEYESYEDLLKLAFNYSKQIIDSGKYKITSDFRALFTSEKLNQNEVIWGRSCLAELEVAHKTSYRFQSAAENRWGPTKDYVMMFLNVDGTPVKSGEVSFTKEFTGRDKRLSATVLSPTMTKKDASGASVAYKPDFTLTTTGYQWVKWVVAEDAPMTSGGVSRCYNSAAYFRYAEVLLNYAEAAEELSLMTEDIWKRTVGELRKNHGGLSNAPYPANAGFVPDSFLRQYYTKGLLHPVSLSETALEIRRERATELMFESSRRYDDLMRWNMGDLIVRRYNNQGWKGIYITQEEAASGFTVAGSRYSVSSKAKDGATSYNVSSIGDNTHTLTNGTYGYLIYNFKLTWDEKLYLSPIPITAINVNPNLSQNNGWQWM